jgi:hypothetical protein
MAGERDPYGRLVDPGEQYQEFMLMMFDLQKDMEDSLICSKDALKHLQEVRLMFMADFQNKYPGYGKCRALWE